MTSRLNYILKAAAIFWWMPLFLFGFAMILYATLPTFLNVTIKNGPALTTVEQVIKKTSPKFVTIKGHIDFNGIRYAGIYDRDLGRYLPEYYLYPFFDSTAREGLYLKTKAVPEDFIAGHTGNITVTAVLEQVPERHKLYHTFIDSTNLSELAQKRLEAYSSINMKKITTDDILKILSGRKNEPPVINDDIYLDADYETYRGFTAYFWGIIAMLISLSGFVLIFFSFIAGIEELSLKQKID